MAKCKPEILVPIIKKHILPGTSVDRVTVGKRSIIFQNYDSNHFPRVNHSNELATSKQGLDTEIILQR